ncbi:histidinol-phosphate aminotransferase [Beggiatoa alba B18LD]|uniref:Histidinol-phosphate aminotransferase n=1 Tax=Beggiatoa alba B18LD TaxID=395493 RepID=I3CFE7_9GAMM|nr:histidinol-phosphate transaminase [Beggiatoa alba]EIJ42340.1 histidinol-phosphate aminotransferase [Beggiatoa alba B18LD]
MICDFFKLATKGAQALQPYQPGKPIDELEREYGIKNAIKLASNENPTGISPLVISAIQAHLQELPRYPDGNGFRLKQALAKYHKLNIDNIALGNGSNDILDLVARAFVSEQDAVLFSAHAFAVYPIVTQAIGAKMIIVPAKNWGHDLTAMRQAITPNTKLIFIANPNNPTGTWVNKTELQNFLDNVPENVIIVLDEAYFDYMDAPDYPDSSLWLDRYPNLVVARTFSKAYGLAALRVGYALAHPDIINLLNRVRQPFNVNTLALIAAEVALQDRAYIQNAVALNKVGLATLTQAFDKMGINYIPSRANFITFDLGKPALPIYEALLHQGVIVRPIGSYGMPNHLRVTVGLPEENERFIQALKKILTQT